MADKPYFVNNGKYMTIKLDQIPALQETLNWGVAGYKGDHVGIKSIATEKTSYVSSWAFSKRLTAAAPQVNDKTP